MRAKATAEAWRALLWASPTLAAGVLFATIAAVTAIYFARPATQAPPDPAETISDSVESWRSAIRYVYLVGMTVGMGLFALLVWSRVVPLGAALGGGSALFAATLTAAAAGTLTGLLQAYLPPSATDERQTRAHMLIALAFFLCMLAFMALALALEVAAAAASLTRVALQTVVLVLTAAAFTVYVVTYAPAAACISVAQGGLERGTVLLAALYLATWQ
jgi:hypothetical protein